jgi:hypothetical protein
MSRVALGFTAELGGEYVDNSAATARIGGLPAGSLVAFA